jgi:uncharacterized protein (DUF1501 family)
MISRRHFLRSAFGAGPLVALAPTVPVFVARTASAAAPDRDRRVLVVLELEGGNDGINTVVPFTDEGYARHRKQLRLSAARVVKVSDKVGLHPVLKPAAELLEAGRFSIVQGVSYPNPSRSHFESMAIWQTARLERADRDGAGWLGRAFDKLPGPDSARPGSFFVGAGPLPVAISGRKAAAASMSRPEDLVLSPAADWKAAVKGTEAADDLLLFARRMAADGYAAAERLAAVRANGGAAGYPESELARQLRDVAALLKAKAAADTRVFYLRQSGYDTHAQQYSTHYRLLQDWAQGVKAFLDDLAAAGLAERVLVLSFSEFGRTVAENASAGTDHGTAGPVLLAGGGVKAGLVGDTPSLEDLDPRHGDLKAGVDFRRVYATVLEDWLGLPAEAALGARFEKLPLVRA